MEQTAPRRPVRLNPTFWMGLSLGMLALIGATDPLTPLALAHGTLYILPVLVAVPTQRNWFVVTMAAASAVLCAGGYWLSPGAYAEALPNLALAGRQLAIVVIMSAAGLGIVVTRTFARVVELQEEVRQQYTLLQIAGEAGQLDGWSVSLPDYRIACTEQVLRILDLTPGHVIRSGEWTAYVDPAFQEVAASRFTQCARDGTPFDEEILLITATGRRVWSRMIGRAVHDAAGRIVAVQGALQDISRRRETEASLIQIQQDFQSFADVMPLIMWSATPDGRIDYSNRVLAQLTGWGDRGGALGEGWINFVHPDDREAALAAWRASLRSGEPYQVEFRIEYCDGSYRWHLSRAVPIRDAQGAIIKWYGTSIDIDAQKRLAARLQIVLESITHGFFILDKEERFIFVNSHGERLARKRRDTMLGRAVLEVFPEAETSTFYQTFREALTTRRSRYIEDFFEPLGMWLEVFYYPSEEGITAYVRDVSERRAAEARLRLLEAAVGRLNDVVMITEAQPLDEPGPSIIFVNEAFERITGYRRTEAIGRSPRFLQGPRTQRSELARIRAALERRQSVRFEVINYRRDGSEYWVELDIAPIVNEQGECTHFVSIQRDITERRAIEERLRQVQRLEALGQLTGGVAHDFNNLLTVIIGNADLLSEELADNPQLHSLASMISKAAQRGAALTHHLLAFARRQALEPRAVDVNQLITDMNPMVRRTLGEHIAIQYVLAPDLWPALVDPAQLESALLNLYLNARDAMAAGGTLTVETSNVELDQAYAARHVEVTPGPYVLIAVSDTGVGIAPEHLSRVFDPFFTTKTPGKGSGLGLSMVYGFIKQSRGHISLYSELGRGTTVKLYLPRCSDPAARHEARTLAEVQSGGHETILLVEDDDLVRDFARQQLISLGYRVLEASDGPAALAILQGPEPIDLLFTDLVMPGGMSGRDLAELGRALRPGLRVLYTSGYAENVIVHHGRLDPGVMLLSKPYHRDDLARKVREALASND